MRQRLLSLGMTLGFLLLASQSFGAGTLTPVGASEKPIQILDHDVTVVINNGFARVEVLQTSTTRTRWIWRPSMHFRFPRAPLSRK